MAFNIGLLLEMVKEMQPLFILLVIYGVLKSRLFSLGPLKWRGNSWEFTGASPLDIGNLLNHMLLLDIENLVGYNIFERHACVILESFSFNRTLSSYLLEYARLYNSRATFDFYIVYITQEKCSQF